MAKPKPHGNNLYQMTFVNNSTGFIISDHIVYKTTDNGGNWFASYTSDNMHAKAITFINESTGFVVGENRIYKTTDLGNNWTFTSNPGGDFYNIIFVNTNTGFVASRNGSILKTVDNGETWSATNFDYEIRDFHFLNETTGYVCGGAGSILITTNAGVNWALQRQGHHSQELTSITFINSLTGFAAGHLAYLVKTTNGGVNWVSDNTTTGTNIFFQDHNTGIITGFGGYYSITTNSGVNWSRYQHPLSFQLNKIYKKGNDYYLLGAFGLLLRSNGITGSWKQLTNTATYNHLSSVYFTSSLTGYAAGDKGTILKTTSGGDQWDPINSNIQLQIRDINFFNENTGYAVADSGKFLKTTNARIDWQIYPTGTSKSFYDVKFLNQNTGFIVGDHSSAGSIFKTTNGGLNWYSTASAAPNTLFTIEFTDNHTGYAGGAYTFLKTTNAGEDWSAVNMGTNRSYYDIKFINGLTGFATVNDKLIYKTTDGGNNWYPDSVKEGRPNKLFLVAPNIIYATNSSSGSILCSTDLGLTWNRNHSFEVYQFSSVHFTSSDTGYVVGQGGAILKTTKGTVGIQEPPSEYPSNYFLFQNYPNPFNPITNISYYLPHRSYVTLKVYDLVGREITQLASGIRSAGTYNVNFDGSGHSSGLYFYILQTDNYLETKKMVLIK